MRLEYLQVERVRGIGQAELEPAGQVNWIVGGNAAGKTTLLEAIFLLSRGKGFRGARYGSLIQRGQQDAQVVSDIVENDRRRRIGVWKSTEGAVWSENGVRRLGPHDLGMPVHVRVIGENAQRLVEGDPELRRWYLDWNLFHVEPTYRETYDRFRRVHAQRNAWLRAGPVGKPVWDREYVELSLAVTQVRRTFVLSLDSELRSLVLATGFHQGVGLRLNAGWPGEESLADKLGQSLAGDRERGYTWYGPGRADMEIRLDGLRTLGSRGENKLIVAMLQVAAQRVWGRRGLDCVWLLDDFGSELAASRMIGAWREILSLGGQVFATALEQPPYEGKVFHVEQGVIRDLP